MSSYSLINAAYGEYSKNDWKVDRIDDCCSTLFPLSTHRCSNRRLNLRRFTDFSLNDKTISFVDAYALWRQSLRINQLAFDDYSLEIRYRSDRRITFLNQYRLLYRSDRSLSFLNRSSLTLKIIKRWARESAFSWKTRLERFVSVIIYRKPREKGYVDGS